MLDAYQIDPTHARGAGIAGYEAERDEQRIVLSIPMDAGGDLIEALLKHLDGMTGAWGPNHPATVRVRYMLYSIQMLWVD